MIIADSNFYGLFMGEQSNGGSNNAVAALQLFSLKNESVWYTTFMQAAGKLFMGCSWVNKATRAAISNCRPAVVFGQPGLNAVSFLWVVHG